MKPIVFLLFWLLSLAALCQQVQPNIYFIHGQGSDKRLFDSLEIDSRYQKNYILYTTPPRHASIESFARELAQQIDTTKPFVLVGVSMGGMLCAEMGEFLKPQKIILISSAKNRTELPFRYRFQRVIPIYYLVPGFVVKASAKVLQPIVEPDRKHNKATFKSMLSAKKCLYMRRTVRMIMQWKRTSNTAPLVHIHGTNDHTLPIRKIKQVDHTVENGSHMMTLTRAQDISALINQELQPLIIPGQN